VVNKTWILGEEMPGGSDAILTVQWNGADEITGFNRGASYLAQYNGTAWIPNGAGAASGIDPFTQIRTNVSVITPISIGSNGTLPVDMVSFTGVLKGKAVSLNWTTASEVNNDRFIVERSADHKTFEAITTVKGAGTRMFVSKYATLDQEAIAYASAQNTQTLYYRLVQVDFDGKRTAHNSVAVSVSATGSRAASITPNPFNAQFDIILDMTVAEVATLQITDLAGRVVASVNAALVPGINNITVKELSEARNGIYFVNMIGTQGSQTIKVVKK
jgi:hypothetical protein